MLTSKSLFRVGAAGLLTCLMTFGLLINPVFATTLTGIVYESDSGAALEGDDGQFYLLTGPDMSDIYETHVSIVGEVKQQEDGTLVVTVEKYEIMKEDAAPEEEPKVQDGDTSASS